MGPTDVQGRRVERGTALQGRRSATHRVVLVSGIYPPDIGGPATHAADLREELRARGHRVFVITLWDGPSASFRPDEVRFPRRWPWPVRHALVAAWLIRHRARYDVVYAAGLHPAAVVGARLAGRPVVVRVVADPAWERGRRLGLTEQAFEEFERGCDAGLRIAAMKWVRDRTLAAATSITTPDPRLAAMVDGWLGGPAGVAVVPNGVRIEGRRRRPEEDPTCLRTVFVGRLVPVKRVERLLEAVGRIHGVLLVIVGDGPERGRLEVRAADLGVQDRVRFIGEVRHEEAMEALASADVLLLASEHEGVPHVVLEALAQGVPVVAASVGAVPDVVRDGANGLLLPGAEAVGIAEALARLRDDRSLLARLSEGARTDGTDRGFNRVGGLVEEVLAGARREKPRVVFVGKTRIGHPVGSELTGKFPILVRHLNPTIVAVGPPRGRRSGRIRTIMFPDLRPPLLGGVVFYTLAPVVALGLTAGRRRGAVVCQSPYEGFGVTALASLLPRRLRPRMLVEVHGDWRIGPRLYGSRARGILAPMSDRAAGWAIRHADRVRVISAWTENLVREAGFRGEVVRYPTFTDLRAFLERPVAGPPRAPIAVYLGALERTKGVDILVEAWARVRDHVPDARLVVAGSGTLREELEWKAGRLGLAGCLTFLGPVSKERVASLIDGAAVVVVPSRSEGLGRVILEAMARGRPVVGTTAGGIPELVEPGVTGWLVAPEDEHELAAAIVGAFSAPEDAARMGAEARRRLTERDPMREFEEGIAGIARWLDGG